MKMQPLKKLRFEPNVNKIFSHDNVCDAEDKVDGTPTFNKPKTETIKMGKNNKIAIMNVEIIDAADSVSVDKVSEAQFKT